LLLSVCMVVDSPTGQAATFALVVFELLYCGCMSATHVGSGSGGESRATQSGYLKPQWATSLES